MSRSRSSSSSASSTADRTSSDDEQPATSGATSRRRRTTSEQSGDHTSNKSNEQSSRKTRSSHTQTDDKPSTKQGARERRSDFKAFRTKSEDQRRKRDEDSPHERGEKRRGETTTSHKAKSSKEVDYSEKLSKPEPKFEPRISMYKYDPLQGVMHETAQYNDHRQRLSRARSLVDNKAPPNFGHVHQNMRRLKEKQEREDEIERDNQRLLERLVKAMTTKRVDNWNNVDNQHLKASRERERQRILQMAADNRKIAQRIETRQATVNSNRQTGTSGSAVSVPPPRPAPAGRGPGGRANERPPWRDD